MHIETKFNVKQKVFCIEKERRIIKKPCNICNGRRTVTLKGKDYKCPECSGNGYGEYQNVYVIHEAVINRIRIGIVQNGNIHVSYKCIYDRDKDLPIKDKRKETSIAEYEDRIFDTYEKADTYCKQMNNGVEFFENVPTAKSEIIKVL